MQVGYVPIAFYEGMSKPAGCEVLPPSPSPSPSPSPAPPPSPSPSPSGGFCCYYPEWLDDCGRCQEKHYEIPESDCHNENKWCPGGSPSPSPTPSPQPAVTLFEKDGSGKLKLTEADFEANYHSGRGGALAWDACAGGTFDNGHAVWEKGVGAFIGSFEISGDWKVVTSNKCGISFNYDNMPVSREHSSDDGRVDAGNVGYFELHAASVAV